MNSFKDILIVEDDAINLLVAKKIFEGPYSIETATNDKEAFSQIEKSNFHVILMDINLGTSSLDGVEIMNKIRALPNFHNCKIYAVTSYAMPEDRNKYLNLGFDYYFSKPINKRLLIETVENDLSNLDLVEN